MARLKPGVSLVQAEQEMKTIFAQVTTAAATTPAQLTRAREHQLRLESGARGNASDLRETLRAVAASPDGHPRRRAAAGQPQRGDAAAVAVGCAAARDGDADRAWRRPVAPGPAAAQRDRGAGRRGRCGGLRRGRLGRTDAARGRHAVGRPSADRAGARLAAGGLHAVGGIRRLPDRGPAAVAARHVVESPRRQPSGRRRTAATAARPRPGRGAGGTLTRAARRRRAVRPDAGESVVAESRLRPPERPDVLDRPTARRQDGRRGADHLPRGPRIAEDRARRTVRHRVGGPPGVRQLLLHRLVQRDRRQDAATGSGACGSRTTTSRPATFPRLAFR